MMKVLSTLLLCCVLSIYANATVFIVDNNPNNTTAYATIQGAIDDASDNDTIYVQPSSNLYDNPLVTKQLVIIAGPVGRIT